MRKLKCTNCGGTLGLVTTPDGHVIGRCGSCGSDYVVEARGRRHVVLEHRFPDGRPFVPAISAPMTRRKSLATVFGVMVIGGGALLLPQLITGVRKRAPDDSPAVQVRFNVGGKGAGPGLFRDYPALVGVDSLGRAMIQDYDRRYYIFGPDGAVLNQFPEPKDGGAMLGVLPDGDIVGNGYENMQRINPLTGKITARVPMPDGDRNWPEGEGSCTTPGGGLAIYRVASRARDADPSLPPPDQLILLDNDLKERRRLSGLMSQALASDPMTTRAPKVTSVAINGAGSIFIAVTRGEDNDSRDGIFEFNADGRFLRRIVTAPKYSPCIIAGFDGRIWLSDPWDNMLEEITPEGVRRINLGTIGPDSGGAVGNITSIAAYPNGDLAVLGSSSSRFVRLTVGSE